MTRHYPVTAPYAELFANLEQQLLNNYPPSVVTRFRLRQTEQSHCWELRDVLRDRVILKLYPGSTKILQWWCIGSGHKAVRLFSAEDFCAMTHAALTRFRVEGEGDIVNIPDTLPRQQIEEMCRALELVAVANRHGVQVAQMRDHWWRLDWAAEGGRPHRSICRVNVQDHRIAEADGSGMFRTPWVCDGDWQRLCREVDRHLGHALADTPVEPAEQPPPAPVAQVASPGPPPPPPANPRVHRDGAVPHQMQELAWEFQMTLNPAFHGEPTEDMRANCWVLRLETQPTRVMGRFYFREYKALMFPKRVHMTDENLQEFHFRDGETFDKGIIYYIEHIGARLERSRRIEATRSLLDKLEIIRDERDAMAERVADLTQALQELRPLDTDPDAPRRRHIDFG